jgi:hypothetical protein
VYSVYIRIIKDFIKKLYKTADSLETSFYIKVNKPFSAPTLDMFFYNRLIMVAAEIGIIL